MSSSHLWSFFNIRFYLPVFIIRISAFSFRLFNLPGQSFFRVLYEFLDFCNRKLHKPTFYITRYTEFPLAISSLSPNIHEQIVDIGCGTSPFPLFLSFCDKKITAADISFHDLNIQKTSSGFHYPAEKLPNFICANSQSLPFKNDSFDKLFCISVIEHLPGETDLKTISEALRILKPDGKAFFSFEMNEKHIEENIKNPGKSSSYCKRYNREDIMNLFFHRKDSLVIDNGCFTRFVGIRKLYQMNRSPWKHQLFDWIQPLFSGLFMMNKTNLSGAKRIPPESWGFVILQKKREAPESASLINSPLK